jgi:predicted CoA-substrate-specific enzyme activase
MIVAGIDAGSRTVKVVLLNAADRTVIASAQADQGVSAGVEAEGLFQRVLAEQHLARADVARVVATGYGRNGVAPADTTITEITCHARGVRHVAPAAQTIIEIGGQDSKLIRLSPDGSVRDFAMNDRCAAGTGRFLEMVAARLGVSIADLGALGDGCLSPAAISSMCAVFAETEIIGLLATGATPAQIAAGVQASVAARISTMAGGRLAEPVILTGGVALVRGMAQRLSATLGHPVTVAPDPQMTGALGAAILACPR